MGDKNQALCTIPEEKTTGVTGVNEKVLEEEEYLSILEKIIQRDFYPELRELQLKDDYIRALDMNDVERLREIQLELEQQTPATNKCFATDSTRDNTDHVSIGDIRDDLNGTDNERKMKKISDNLTLDKFLMKNTSEDNASFRKVMELTRLKYKEKYAWLHNQQKDLHQRVDASRALPSSAEEQLKAIEAKSNNLDTWKYEAKNTLMYVPEGVELSHEELLQKKSKKEKEIHYENTRFKSDPFDNKACHSAMAKVVKEQAQMKSVVGKIGVDGKLEKSDLTQSEKEYPLLAEPSPAPGVDASPLMTWGEIEGTPMRLDATPAPNFKIPEPPRREQLAHSLVEKVSKQHREKRKKAFAAATANILSPKYTPKSRISDRLTQLSPAARKLVKTASARLKTDETLRASYSTPLVRKTPSVRDNKTPLTPNTPVERKGAVNNSWSSKTTESSLTDNLLDLPNT